MANRFIWLNEAGMIDRAASLFADDLDPSYISHSELQFGRAKTETEWFPDLAGFLVDEIAERVPFDKSPNARVACAYVDQKLVGVAFVCWNLGVRIPFGVVEDIVIDKSLRGQGVGQQFMDWIFDEAKRQGLKRLFLESGKENHDAHHFFERNKFRQVSIVMMADVG